MNVFKIRFLETFIPLFLISAVFTSFEYVWQSSLPHFLSLLFPVGALVAELITYFRFTERYGYYCLDGQEYIKITAINLLIMLIFVVCGSLLIPEPYYTILFCPFDFLSSFGIVNKTVSGIVAWLLFVVISFFV